MSVSRVRAGAFAAALLPALAQAAPLTLDEALQQALRRSEATHSARASRLGALQAAQAAGQLPDPMLGVSIENLPVTGPDRLRTTRESMTMKRIALSQEWIPADKRSLRSAAGGAMVARESASVAAAAADTRLQTAMAFVDAWYAAEAAKLGEMNESHAREATVTSRARLSAGSGAAPELLGFSSAQGMAADDAAEARQLVSATQVNLARWTGAAPEELVAPAIGAASSEQVFVDLHPVVVARDREIAIARAEAASTAANRRPNWTWEIAYGQRTGFSDLISVGVNIPLPVAPQARQDRETAAKLALAEKAEAELAEATRAAHAEYRALASDGERLAQRRKNYEAAVLAPAIQRTATATAAYRSGQASLALVFESRHAELEARRKLLALERDFAKVQAQLAFKPLKPEDLQ